MSLEQKAYFQEGRRSMYVDILTIVDKEIKDLSWAHDVVATPLSDLRWQITREYGYLLKEASGEPAVVDRDAT